MSKTQHAKLTDKQLIFCKEYIVDLNSAQAAIRAGYSKKTAFSIGCENLSKPYIADEIQRLMKARSEKTEITAERVLEEVASLAFINVQDMYNEDGTLKNITELDEKVARALSQVEVSELRNADNDVEQVKKVKTYDKLRALDLLGKHLKLFNQTVDHTGEVSIKVAGPKDETLDKV